jgi:Family of unknown function (DUF6476)
MRALKILVVVLGVLLVGGFITLVVVIAGRIAQRQTAPTATQPAPPPFAAAPIELPAGARIETIAVGPDRIVVHLALPGGNRELVIIDLASGRRLGAIPLRTAP